MASRRSRIEHDTHAGTYVVEGVKAYRTMLHIG